MTASSRAGRARLLWLACAAIAALCCAHLGSAQSSLGFQPFDFALLGDPQIGYGHAGEYGDAGRLAQVIASVNQGKIPLTLVAGDLVQDRSLLQVFTFDWARKRLAGRVALAAGNHDVVDQDGLRAFRRRFGKDYYDLVSHNCAFVIVDSETARDRRISGAEFDAQWAFLERTLAAHQQARRKHIILVMHRPPFVESEQEAENGANWPTDTRARLLGLARRHGVRWILAGHLHRTLSVDTADGIHVVVSAGSARSFDRSPVAYYRFHVDEDGLRYALVSVAPAMPEPFSVPGLRDWTPRIFDFSLRHWLFTILYAVAAMFALRASKELGRSGQDPPRQKLWFAIAIMLFFFGANMQLDFDEAIREIGRLLARRAGVYGIRHVITGSAAAAVTLGSSVLLIRYYLRSKGDRATAIALCMLAVPCAWFGLSAISHHDIGMLFDEMLWDLLTLIALLVISICARRVAKNESRTVPRSPAPARRG
jgi:3',5'-cyclic AMP phosphodiesterase CpdA